MSIILLGIVINFFVAIMLGLKKMKSKSVYYIKALNLVRDPLEYTEGVQIYHYWTTALSWDGKEKKYVVPDTGGMLGYQSPLNNMKKILNNPYYDSLLPKKYPHSIFAYAYLFYGQPYYTGTFITWKGNDGKRRGLALGVIPYTQLNTATISINDFYWKSK